MNFASLSSPKLHFQRVMMTLLMIFISSNIFAFTPIEKTNSKNRVIKTHKGIILKQNQNNFKPLLVAGADVGIIKSSDRTTAAINDQVTFILKVYNEGTTDATNVIVTDPVPSGTNYVSSSPIGAYDSGTGEWNVGTVPQGDTLTFTYTVQIVSDGVAISEAEVSSMTETDMDSTPNNGNPSEDDWSSACVSIPMYFCNINQIEVEVEAPAAFSSVKWYRNGVLVDTNKIYTIKDFGDYHYEATTGGVSNCPVELCCPIQVKQKCLALGDLVWADVNNNGIKDNGENGIENIEVVLYSTGTDSLKNGNDIALDTILTDTNGNYLFDNLAEGHYYVKLQDVPVKYTSSTGEGIYDNDHTGPYENGADPDNNINNNDDGTEMVGTGMIMSDVITLVYESEPINDDDTDANTNTTVDFGLYEPQTFDLALNKTVAVGQPASYNLGDNVTFTINVYNQGTVPAYNVLLSDYIPTGLVLADANWTEVGGVASTVIDTLNAGESASVDIVFTISNSFTGTSIKNEAEISSADDDDNANNGTPTDIDSTPDKNPTNDGVAKDDEINEDGKNGGDEDDADFEVIPVIQTNPTLSLGNLVWNDTDNDGIKDVSELGIPNIKVVLYDAGTDGKDPTDVAIDSTTTDANGNYLFAGLEEGIYYIKLTGEGVPFGMVSSNGLGTPYQAGNGSHEPGIAGINNQDNGTQMGVMIMSDTVHLIINNEPINDGDTDPNTNLTVDFGLHKPILPAPTLSIGNLVWNDVDNNGLFDNGEEGIPNVEVILYDAGSNGKDGTDIPVDTAYTDANGNYLFDGLPEGNYYIKLTGVGIPQGWYSSTGDGTEDYDLQGQYEPASSNDVNNVDNGTMMGTMVMSDIVELTEGDEPDNDGDTDTNTNLTIDFGFFRPDTFDLALNKRLADGQSPIVVPGDTLIYTLEVTNLGNVEGIDVVIADYLPADLILADDNWVEIGGIALLITPIPSILPGATESVNIKTIINPDFKGGSLANFATIDVPIDSFPDNDTDIVIIDVRKNLLSLGDLVWEDLDNDGQKDPSETGIQGVVMQLYNAGGNGKDATDTLKATTTTDADGFYIFKDLQAGNYYVKISGGIPAGYISSTGNGPTDTGTNGNYEPSTVIDGNNQDNGTQMGAMIMSDIVVLEYDKEPTNDGDNDETTNLTVDFGLYKPVEIPAGLSGRTFVDCNNDGISTGDSPLSGVTVTLTGGTTPQTTTTDVNGMYSFGSLAAGTYTLTFSKPTGLTYTTANVGSNDAVDSDVNGTTGDVSFTLTAGQDAMYDAGYADKDAPTFVTATPADLTVECDAIPTIATLQATDTYDSNVSVNNVETKTDGSCLDSYILTRTWTASDDCGNTATVQQRITVRDTQAPTFNAPNIRDLTVSCGNIPSVPTGITAIDNCDKDVSISYSENRLDGNCSDSYVIVRTWTATDNCGNQTPFVQRITVQDLEAPQFTTTIQDLTVECDEVPGLPAIAADDNCDNDVRILLDEDNIDGICADSYQIVRTWTAVDNCGNTATLRQTIVVRDTKAPTFSNAPASVTINCGQTVNATPSASDNCDKDVQVTIVDSQISGDCATGRTATRTYTATDNCGNKATFVQTIYVVDNQAPVLAGTPVNVTVTCKELPPPAKINVQDNCPDAVMVMFDERKTAGDNCTGYIITRTWTAMDACGNTASYQQVITVQGDFVAPVITGVPANADYDCGVTIPVPPTVSVSDDCDNNPKLGFTEDKLGEGCGYKLVRIWTATDACGNKSTKEQVITVRDRTAPIITGVPSDLTVDCADALPPVGTPIASDACDNSVNLVYNGEQIVGDKNACEYQVIRTWTATDKCGNSTSKSQTINVRDSKAPTVIPTHPMFAGIPNGGTVTIECEKDLIVMSENDATATDNCDKNPTIKFEEYDAKKGDCDVDGYSFKISCRWTATDKCGNSSAYVVHVVVKDTKAPIFTNAPANVTLSCGQTIPNPTTPSVTDNCDTSVDVVFGENTTPGNCPGTSTIRRTWTSTDDCGNKSTVTQTIVIEDKTAPVITNVPTNQTVACGQTPSDAQKPNVSDNCDANVNLTYTDAISTNGGCLGSIIRTWTATDDCGNVATAQQIITIEDKEAPKLAGIPANQDGLCDAPVNTANVTATDNCDKDVKIEYKEEKQGTSCNYTLTRTWTATDDCGNTTSARQVITVEDRVAPVLSGVPANTDASCDYVAIPANVTATDNCDKDVKIDYKESKIGQGCQYKLVRTWTATDDCGNTAEGSQVVNVRDTKAPTITLPITDITIDCKDIASIPTDATATDDCDKDVAITHNDVKVGTGCTYQIMRTFTAKDDCDNTATAVLTVTVQDKTAPVITFKDPILIAANPGDTLIFSCDKLPAYNEDTAEATDDCSGVKLTKNDKRVEFKDVVLREGNCLGDGYLHLLYCEWKATDNCGNVSTWHMYVKIVDDKAPVLEGVPNNMTLNCEQSVPSAPTVTAKDNCTQNVKVNYSETPYTGAPCVLAGSVIRTWTATDDCGNVASSSQRIVVTDNEKPTLIGVPTADITLSENETAPTITIKAVDKCDTDVTVTTNDVKTSTACEDITTYSILAKDDCGNEAIATFKVIRKKTTTLVATIDIKSSPEICNKKDGSVVMTPTNYTYTWADGFTGATRSGLVAGNYMITVSDGACASKLVTVTVGADCPPVCVKPKLASSIITKNGCGTTPTGTINFTLENANNNDYNFAWSTTNGSLTSATGLTEGSYSVTVTQKTDATCFDVFTFTVTKEDCPPVCVKPALDGSNTTESGCGTAATGSIIFNLKDGNVTDYNYTWSTPLGNQNIANGLAAGQYTVTVTRKSDITCLDVFTFNITKKVGINVFTDDALNLEITDCQNGKASVCANLTPSDITNALYTFTDNGSPFLGSFKGCKFDTTFYYNPKLTVGQNPYSLTGWLVNGKTLTGEFNTISELVTLMNSLDKGGNWVLTQSGNVSGGNRANVYGRMDIRSKNNPSATSVVELETKLTPYNMALQVGEGTHIIVATSADGCTDEIKVKVDCKPLPPTCTSFILWESENIFTNCGTPAKICYEELPFAQIGDINILDNGQAYTGGTAACTNGGTELTLTNGVHQIIFIKKDGCRDTSVVKVACTSARLIKDTVYVAQKDTVCLDVAELIGDIKSIKNLWPSKSGTHAKFELLPGSRCVTCLGVKAGGMDEAAYVIEDTKGIFDTTYFQISVLERTQTVPSPEAVADQGTTKEGEAMILDVLANDKLGGAKLTTIKIVDQPKNGTVFIDQSNRIVFTPNPDFCNDDDDEYFSYQICTVGGCDDAPVTIKVLCSNIKVYTGFSPNGDGVNDFFYIEGANADTENKLSIFNRWGNQVYYKEAYRNEWGGTWDDKQLPDGTYFYLYEDGKGNKKAGYVQIQR